MVEASRFSGVILAGGESSRMGRDKAFLTLPNGQTLLQRQIDLMRAVGVEDIFVSGRTGVDYPFESPPVLEDDLPGQGPLGGIQTIMRRMGGEHLLVLAVDMPCMRKELLKTLQQMAAPGRGTVPVVGGFYEPLAACYPKTILPLIEARLNDGARALQSFLEIARIAGLMSAFEVPEEDRVLFCNWNLPEDFVFAGSSQDEK